VDTKQRLKVWLWVIGGFVVLLIVLFDGHDRSSSSSSQSSSTDLSTRQSNGNSGFVSAGSVGSGNVVGSGRYATVGTNVRLRQSATTNSDIVTTMQPHGAGLFLSCYEFGQSIFGDTTWYRARYAAMNGYVAGYWVDTGPDPASDSLPSCS
jgi:hypothetical protein